MKKLKGLIRKETIFYILFGILTAIVNIGFFYVLSSFFHIEENFSNMIAISLAVLASYFTNKDLVFHSQADEFGEKVVEFCKFLLGRLFTMAFEYIGCSLLFKYTPILPIVSKCTITTLVVIVNFYVSIFCTFKPKEAI